VGGGYGRFDLLHRSGLSATAFDFQRPFDDDGAPTRLERR
jgi:hypothetical protein